MPTKKKKPTSKPKLSAAMKKIIEAEIEKTCTEKTKFVKNSNRTQPCPECGSPVRFELHSGEKVPCYNTGRANGLRWLLQNY